MSTLPSIGAPPLKPDLSVTSDKSVPLESLSARSALYILLLLTILAAAVRFPHLERPPLLIDECFTFWRTCGSYSDLVGTLRDDGFVPLHYELLWWIGAGMPIGHLHLVSGGIYL